MYIYFWLTKLRHCPGGPQIPAGHAQGAQIQVSDSIPHWLIPQLHIGIVLCTRLEVLGDGAPGNHRVAI